MASAERIARATAPWPASLAPSDFAPSVRGSQAPWRWLTSSAVANERNGMHFTARTGTGCAGMNPADIRKRGAEGDPSPFGGMAGLKIVRASKSSDLPGWGEIQVSP